MGPDESTTPEEWQRIKSFPYRSLIGTLQYFRLTRVDVLQAISECAKFQNNPGIKHIEAALRILVYLKHHPDWGLLYTSTGKKPGEAWELELYVDSDHASDPDYRRSRTGFIVRANKQNLVDFGTAMQARTATSTPVAEYVALASGLKQLLWIKQIIEECGIEVQIPMLVEEDNQTCIAVAKNPMAQKRTRHMDIKLHFIRDYINDGTIVLHWCPTTEMLADMLTKALAKSELATARAKILSKEIL